MKLQEAIFDLLLLSLLVLGIATKVANVSGRRAFGHSWLYCLTQ